MEHACPVLLALSSAPLSRFIPALACPVLLRFAHQHSGRSGVGRDQENRQESGQHHRNAPANTAPH